MAARAAPAAARALPPSLHLYLSIRMSAAKTTINLPLLWLDRSDRDRPPARLHLTVAVHDSAFVLATQLFGVFRRRRDEGRTRTDGRLLKVSKHFSSRRILEHALPATAAAAAGQRTDRSCLPFLGRSFDLQASGAASP